MRIRVVLLLSSLLVAATAGVLIFGAMSHEGSRGLPPAPGAKIPIYQCAMHPQIVSDKPGLCPICQMKLQRVDEVSESDAAARTAASAATGAPQPASKVIFYRHPMRADVTSPVPAKDEMGMDYIPVHEEDLSGGAGDVPGHAAFTLSTERQQLIGVTKSRVVKRPLEVEVSTVGKVAYDPTLYAAITEYREAVRATRGLKDSTVPEAHEGAQAIVQSAKLKLRQMGISDQQLRGLAEDPSAVTNLLLPGKTAWIYAQVYEYEIDLIHPGQTMVITTPALPGRSFSARVIAIDSILNPTTRTGRVRALMQTPDTTLRPETFVRAKIAVPLGEKLAVPEDAVLDTGEHRMVFVVTGAGKFEPRAVGLGREAQGYYEVLSGLAAGDEVVTSANFLIDSESRFRAAIAAFTAKAPAAGSK